MVEQPEHAAAGFQIVREAAAGRCGFVIASAAAVSPSECARPDDVAADPSAPDGLIALSSVVRIKGPYADALRAAIADAWIAPSYERAAGVSALTSRAVATVDGDVFRGPALVSGGAPAEARGILETKREIPELRTRTPPTPHGLFPLPHAPAA